MKVERLQLKMPKELTMTCSSVILAVCLIGYLKPPFASWHPMLSLLFNGLRMVSLALTVAYAVVSCVKLSKFTWVMIAYQLVYILTTIFRQGNVAQAIIGAATIVGEIVLFETAVKRNLVNFLRTICAILTVYVVLNLLTVMFIPQGLYLTENNSPVFFLGMHNRFVFWMLPLICLSSVYAYLTVGKLTWKQYAIHAICLATLILEWAVGAMIGLLIMVAYFLVVDRMSVSVADYRLYLVIYLLLWVTMTFMDTLDAWDWLTYGIFGKSDTLDARLRLWTKGKKYLFSDLSHFLFGCGLESDAVIKEKFWYVHLHNNLLNVMYQTGLVGAAVYTSAFLTIIKPLVRFKDHPVGKLLAFTLFAFFIMLLMDTYDLYGHFYVLGVLAANIPIILKQYDPMQQCRPAKLRLQL